MQLELKLPKLVCCLGESSHIPLHVYEYDSVIWKKASICWTNIVPAYNQYLNMYKHFKIYYEYKIRHLIKKIVMLTSA